MSHAARIFAFVLVTAPAPSALAAGPPPEREAARALAGKAYDAFEAREYKRAIELFREAEARFHAPPHLLYVARAQAKLAMLLDARATYQRVVDEKLAADAPVPFKEAQASARAELEKVAQLTPTLVVALGDGWPPDARVLLDGEPLSAADLRRPLARDPGEHAVAVAAAIGSVERRVLLEMGSGREERVTLAPPARPLGVVPGVVTLSIGLAAVGVGTAGALLDRNASPSHAAGFRAMEIAGFTAGGAGVAAGIVLLAVHAKTTNGARASTCGASRRERVREHVAVVRVSPAAVSLATSF